VEQKKESNFAEVQVDRLFMESFANEASAYYKTAQDIERDEQLEKYKSRLKWHMNHSLSRRQKQVMRLYLEGKRQREIGDILGIKQQVVSIYKKRAISKLREKLRQ
jgi:RNA polymerase sigma factor (sigma-70 family)